MNIPEKNTVFICPTDTIYGICTSAFDKKNVEKIYTLKGRDENKAFIILISKISDLKKFGITLTKTQADFLKRNWPGPLSVILPCPLKKLEYLHRGLYSLAFRIPKKKKIIDILQKIGPIVAPSANPQGEKPANTISQAKKYFGYNVDLYISAGRLEGKPSTIVSFQKNKLITIRQGSFKPKL